MKNIANFFLIGLLLFSIHSCKDKEGGEPLDFCYFFVFNDFKENVDFFSKNRNYDINKIIFFNNFGDYYLNAKYQIKESTRFQIYPRSFEKLYINYGNGDIDTLSQVWEPSDRSNPATDKIDNLKIFFNGSLVKVFDYKKQPNLYQELAMRNNPLSEFWKNDPIIIEIVKKPEL